MPLMENPFYKNECSWNFIFKIHVEYEETENKE